MKIKATLPKLPVFNRNFYFYLLISILILGCGQKDDDTQNASGNTTTRRVARAWLEMGRNSSSNGGISNITGKSLSPDITINGNNNPFICWTHESEQGLQRQSEIFFKHWNGTSWVEMGNNSASGSGISNTVGNSTEPQIVISSTGNPIICWREESDTGIPAVGQIYVKQWNGTAWVEMGRNSASGGGISQNQKYSSGPSIAIDLEGDPIICWGQMLEIDSQIHVRQWNGYAWARMENIIAEIPRDTTQMSSERARILPAVVQPKVAVATDGNPIICWADYSRGNYEIYVKHWDGQTWADMGSDSSSKSGISGSSGQSINPDITVDRDGVPIICWEDDTRGNSEIYVRRWNNYEWIQVGENSASRGGISDDDLKSSMPRISVNRENKPVISWTTGSDIYVKYYDGSEWIETAQGSASEYDSSGTTSEAGAPAMTIDYNNNLIATFDNSISNENSQIYVRKYTFPAESRQRR